LSLLWDGLPALESASLTVRSFRASDMCIGQPFSSSHCHKPGQPGKSGGSHDADEAETHPFDTTIDGLRHATDRLGRAEPIRLCEGVRIFACADWGRVQAPPAPTAHPGESTKTANRPPAHQPVLYRAPPTRPHFHREIRLVSDGMLPIPWLPQSDLALPP